MRQPAANVLVGAPGCGKTHWLIKKVAMPARRNVCIVTSWEDLDQPIFQPFSHKSYENWRQGAAPNTPVKFKIAVDRKEYRKELLPWAKEEFRNGVLIIDDTTVFERNSISDELYELLAKRRHWGIDVFLTYHGFTQFPIDQYAFVKNIIVFNTVDNPAYKKDKIPEFPVLMQAAAKARANFAKGSFDPAIVRRY